MKVWAACLVALVAGGALAAARRHARPRRCRARRRPAPSRSTCSRGLMSATATSTSRFRTRWPRSSGSGGSRALYDTVIRTDSQPDHEAAASPSRPGRGSRPASSFSPRNLNYFDAIFFFGVREIDLTPISGPTCWRSCGMTARASSRRTRAPRRSSRGPSSATCLAAASTSTRGTSPSAHGPRRGPGVPAR